MNFERTMASLRGSLAQGHRAMINIGWTHSNVKSLDTFDELNENLTALFVILKHEWENDMLIGDAGDLLKKLGVVE